MLAGLVASVIVVMLSVAVINEVLERSRRRRWSTLAQYVMFELVRNARMIWLGVSSRLEDRRSSRTTPSSSRSRPRRSETQHG